MHSFKKSFQKNRDEICSHLKNLINYAIRLFLKNQSSETINTKMRACGPAWKWSWWMRHMTPQPMAYPTSWAARLGCSKSCGWFVFWPRVAVVVTFWSKVSSTTWATRWWPQFARCPTHQPSFPQSHCAMQTWSRTRTRWTTSRAECCPIRPFSWPRLDCTFPWSINANLMHSFVLFKIDVRFF